MFGADNPLALLGIYQPGSVAGVDYVGAALQRPLPLNRPLAHPQYAQGPTMAAQQSPSSDDKLRALQQLSMANYVPQIPLGFGDTTTKVKAGAAFSFSPEPSVPMRLTSVYVAPSIAPFFTITTMKVARLDMLAGATSVPAEMFIPNSRHAPIENPILAAGSQVIIAGVNIDGADHFFTGAFMGIDLTSPYARLV